MSKIQMTKSITIASITLSEKEFTAWRELGEAAAELVADRMDGDECDECRCPLPEDPSDPHDKGCKVGRVVRALSAVGIDPEDR